MTKKYLKRNKKGLQNGLKDYFSNAIIFHFDTNFSPIFCLKTEKSESVFILKKN